MVDSVECGTQVYEYQYRHLTSIYCANSIIMNDSNSSLRGMMLSISQLPRRQRMIQVGVFVESVHDQSLSYL